MSDSPTAVIGWHADDTDPAIASIRLRMLQPMRELAALGIAVTRYDAGRGPGAYSTLVFSKSLSREGLAVALEARRCGRRVIYDLCDNLYDSRPSAKRTRRLAVLEQFLSIADQVVFATPALQRQMLERHPDLASRCHIIPDALEPLPTDDRPDWLGRWQLWWLRRFLRQHGDALHCVWFGKSQGSLAGLDHVQTAVHELESFSRYRPVTLTVISNRRLKYRSVSGDWKIPHHYLPWSLSTFSAALRAHDVAIVPVERNGYTVGKSINRPATAIMAGLGVVGDSIESYEELRPYIMLDCWQEGLRHYARNPPACEPRLAQARKYLSERYGGRRIALQWKALLDSGAGQPTRAPDG